jgi:hypothetical protein
MTLGVMGVPLSYVIRQDETPKEDAVYNTFVEECIARAPLEGTAFEADARHVHQIILSLTAGEHSEQWIKPLRKEQNGRRDIEALRNHYQGEGNSSRRIAEAERLRDTLHYKSERSMAFQTFLSKSQHMFNLFETEAEAYTEAMKLRFLLERVQHPELKASVAALKVKNNAGDEVTFTSAANHLAAELSTTQDFQTSQQRRSNVSFVESGKEAAPTSGIMKHGEIYTGYLPHWNKLSKDEKQKVINERKRLGKGKKMSSGKKQGGRKAASVKSLKKDLKDLKESLEERIVAAVKRASKPDEPDSEDTTASQNNAGTSFGGRKSKKAKREE